MCNSRFYISKADMLACSIIITAFLVARGGPIAGQQFLNNLTKNYDKLLRPSINGSSTEVAVQLALVALGPISEKTLTLKSDVFFRQFWYDERLNTNDGLIHNYNVDPTKFIWVPDTFIGNARETKSHRALTDNIKLQIGPNGKVYVSTRLTLECSCEMDLKLYPMDVQYCKILLESYAFSSREITYKWLTPETPLVFTKGNIEVSGYKVISVTGSNSDIRYLGERFSVLLATLKIERTFPYFLFHVYLPGALLVALSWSTFYIPATAIPARVTLIVTNFLSTMFIFGSTATLIPMVPYITAIEVYSLVNIIFIMLVMVEYIFVLKFGKKKDCRFQSKCTTQAKNQRMEMQDVSNGHVEPQQKMEVKTEDKNKGCHWFDWVSRFLFPLTYSLFLIIYFVFYKYNENTDSGNPRS